MDKLERLFGLQEDLQKRFSHGVNLVGNQEYITSMTVALIDEAMEAIRETPWKYWKKQQMHI